MSLSQFFFKSSDAVGTEKSDHNRQSGLSSEVTIMRGFTVCS